MKNIYNMSMEKTQNSNHLIAIFRGKARISAREIKKQKIG